MRNASSDNQEMEESSQYDYEVFLSFRGPDTRTDIADYLYISMIDAGIGVFRDDGELRLGEEISGQLLQAIEQSKISIPIFSKGYADSAWCLRELVKMVESKKTRGQKIIPLFYDVAPSEVKYQKDHYSSAFFSHKNRFNDETINNWKATLKEVGELIGWDLHGKPNRGKGEFVKEVVNDVLTKLKTTYLEVPDCLVDVDRHVDEIMRLIGAHNPETKIVGIHGIGGMGKTTLAKIVYNQLSKDFSDCCFLSNIRETEITRLQNQLISTILRRQDYDIHNITEGKKVLGQRLRNKKVLLLLDDTDKASQLDALVQKREWFAKGSKIIITTRDCEILNMPSLVDGTYELIDMDFDHSLQLFSKHAFKRDYPLEKYIFHSERAIKICGGLPLALEAIGSLLSRKSIEEWDATLKELEEFPHEDVERKLMTSIDALNENQRKIFLDVACFFIGYDKRIVIHMWESCKFFRKQSLEVLQQRSLIKIRDDNQLWMHDWLRNIGRNFIQEESGMKPENQRWVWTYEQALDVLLKMQNGGGVHGMGSIEAICLEFDELSQYSLIKQFLAGLSNLKFLLVNKKSIIPQVDSKDFNGDSMSILTQVDHFQYYWRSNFLQTTRGPLILPELRWLSWNYFPMDYELTNFSLRKLVIIELLRSNITEEWVGWSHIMRARNLKVLNLTGCQELHEIPDLSSLMNLERLILEGCRSLAKIGPTISHLKRLVFLNLKDCYHLSMLREEIGELESLEELLLDSTFMEEISQSRMGNRMQIVSSFKCESLIKFNIVFFLRELEHLAVENLAVDILSVGLSEWIENFNSVTELIQCLAIQELPDSNGNMKYLKLLKMRNGFIRKRPSATFVMEKVEESMVGVFAKLGVKTPDNIGMQRLLICLRVNTSRSDQLRSLLERQRHLHLQSEPLQIRPLSNPLQLSILHMYFPRITTPLQLRILHMYSPRITTLSPDIIFLSQLKELKLYCKNLQCLPRLPTNLSCLWIEESNRLKTTNDLSDLKKLQRFAVRNCRRLTEVQGLEGLQNLRELVLERLPSLATEVQGLEGLQNLRELVLERLPSLAKLPRLTNLKELEETRLKDCPKLFEFRCGLN